MWIFYNCRNRVHSESLVIEEIHCVSQSFLKDGRGLKFLRQIARLTILEIPKGSTGFLLLNLLTTLQGKYVRFYQAQKRAEFLQFRLYEAVSFADKSVCSRNILSGIRTFLVYGKRHTTVMHLHEKIIAANGQKRWR
jgi:hypothetical protein